MRVISGEYRGRQLKALKGNNTRPTTDRVKESLMSSIVSTLDGFEGLVVLDAFAGSGALGIESLSRGSSFVVFCEINREAHKTVTENLSLVKADRRSYKLLKENVLLLPFGILDRTYDLVFLDPPYAFEAQEVISFIKAIDKEGCFSETVLICYEHAKKDMQVVSHAVEEEGYTVFSQKKYGDTAITMIRKA
ncbi:MAG: 16S rRNA (guanine(966)-N(2))-methyltransferase RsmD [Anaerotardibacter sp.]